MLEFLDKLYIVASKFFLGTMIRRVSMRVLFVCNANIVRSFMAERILRNRLKGRAAPAPSVSSAGLLDMNGAPADPMARLILRENGIDDESHRSRLLTEEIVSDADLIITMEAVQLTTIEKRFPESRKTLRVLKSYLTDYDPQDGDIADPYRRSAFHYRLCFAEITLCVEAMIPCI